MTGSAVVQGCQVTLHFVLTLTDGTLIDRSEQDAPLVITLGRNELAPGLESCLIGLRCGDRRHFDVLADNAYGPRLEENVHVIAREQFPADANLEPGVVMEFTLPSGEAVPGRIVAVDDSMAAVDFSHPLAGHDLVFDVEIIAVEPPAVVSGGPARS